MVSLALRHKIPPPLPRLRKMDRCRWLMSNDCIHSFILQYIFEFQFQPGRECSEKIRCWAMSNAVTNRIHSAPSQELTRVLGAEAKSKVVSLHGEILSRLRDFIVEGHLTGGARIPERQLCDMFGISRTP